jgi:hypothetical protein
LGSHTMPLPRPLIDITLSYQEVILEGAPVCGYPDGRKGARAEDPTVYRPRRTVPNSILVTAAASSAWPAKGGSGPPQIDLHDYHPALAAEHRF